MESFPPPVSGHVPTKNGHVPIQPRGPSQRRRRVRHQSTFPQTQSMFLRTIHVPQLTSVSQDAIVTRAEWPDAVRAWKTDWSTVTRVARRPGWVRIES
jgi:hypothetical protein